MQIGIIGLGRMGAGMARRLARGGAPVLCYDQAEAARAGVASEPGIECVEDLAALCTRMEGERVMLLSLPAGGAVEDTIRSLMPLIATGDTLVDGGNSYYRDSMRRALAFAAGVALHRRGRLRRRARSGAGLLPDARRHAEIDRDLRAVRAPLGAGSRARLAALRAERRRPLRQDDPQRHRVRDDAVASRRVRPARGASRARHRRRAPRRDLAPRQRGAFVAARSLRRDPRAG